MTLSIEDRLTAAEKKVNSILEILQDSITVTETSRHVEILDSEEKTIDYRIKRIETTIDTLRFMWQQAVNRANS